MNNFWKDFKKFINKGNIIELAIGIIVGSAFSTMLNSLVYDIFMPLISKALDFDIIGAKWILSPAVLDVDGETILKAEIALKYGQFIQYVINFLVIALSIFVAMKVYKKLADRNLKRKAKWVRKMQIKRPELFNENDKIQYPVEWWYAKIMREHPEYLQDDDEVAKIEEAEVEQHNDPKIIELELLASINEKLSLLTEKKEEVNEETKETQ